MCLCVMTQGMDQRQRPPLFCGNQWDWILKVFSGASAPLVNTALCHKCILYTQTHMQTHKHFQFLFPSQTSPFSAYAFWCSSSPQLNLSHFPLFAHPVFYQHHPLCTLVSIMFFKSQLTLFVFSFSFFLDMPFSGSVYECVWGFFSTQSN